MLNHAAIDALEHDHPLARRASLGAALTPAEKGAAQGKADKNNGEPIDLNYGAAHFGVAADASAAQAAYEKAYNAARSPEQGWILWLGLVLASGLALFAYGFGALGKKDGGGSAPKALPPKGEESLYGTGAGAAYGTYNDGSCSGSW